MPTIPSNLFTTPYSQNLIADPEFYQEATETLLQKYKVFSVGNNYIDLIVNIAEAVDLMDELATIPIAVSEISWWCYCTAPDKSSGCPHGDGRRCANAPGYYTHCTYYPAFDLRAQGVAFENPFTAPRMLAGKAREAAAKYLLHVLPTEAFFTPCLNAGISLEVPGTWVRKRQAEPPKIT